MGSHDDPGAGNPSPSREPPKPSSNDSGHITGGGNNENAKQPSEFDRSLKTTDVWIAVFAGITAAAAIASAWVAIWTASQLGASSAQTDAAICKLAALADQTKRQADNLHDQLTPLTDEARSAKDSATAAQASIIQANRAWLAMVGVRLADPINRPGDILSSYVIFDNSGKSPALNIAPVERYFSYKTKWESNGDRMISGGEQKIPPNDTCKDIGSQIRGITVWPDPRNPSQYMGPKGIPVDEQFFSGDKTYGVHGCIGYYTFGKLHHTKYCYTLGWSPDYTPDKWVWGACPGKGQQDAD